MELIHRCDPLGELKPWCVVVKEFIGDGIMFLIGLMMGYKSINSDDYTTNQRTEDCSCDVFA